MERTAFTVRIPQATALRPLNYLPEIERLRERGGSNSIQLGALLRSMGESYGSRFTRLPTSPGLGLEMLSQGDMFQAEPRGQWLRADSMPNPERHRIRKWQIIASGAGTLGDTELYGRCLIADGRLVGRYVGSHALAMTFEQEGGDLNLYAYAFLCTDVGVRAMRSLSYGTKILAIRMDMLSSLPIPLAPEETIQRVAALIREAVARRERYAASLSAARALVEDLPAMRSAHEMCAERRARCLLWDGELRSFGAWNSVSAGEALPFLCQTWKARIADVLPSDGIFYGLLRQRTPCDARFGVPLITQRDAQSIRQIPSWIVHPRVSDRALFSPPNSIVVPGRGTLGEGEVFGRPILLTPLLSKYALTQDLLRIVPRPGFAPLVHAFLSTLVGMRLLRSAAVGTKILQLRLDLIRELPLPELSDRTHAELRRLHADAVDSFDRASAAEQEAVRIVEEEVLSQWLA